VIPFAKRSRAQRAAAVVGVDAGKFAHTLVVRPKGQSDSKPCTVPTTRAGFETAVAFIHRSSGGAAPASILVGIEFAGNYGFTFAHYLAQRGFGVVSVLAAHTKRWKDVVHRQPLKTDAKDAATITDLLAQGHFVAFPFLEPAYADLRYLAAGRERLSLLRRGALTQLRTLLQVVFPEFEALFSRITKKTPLALLRAYPAPQDLLATPRRQVLRVLQRASRGHCSRSAYEELIAAARTTLGLPGAQSGLRHEIALTLERLDVYDRHIRLLERRMVTALAAVPEAPCLLSIPKLGPVTAAIFLGAVGDPRAYESGEQILRVAGLSLVERSSGILHGTKRLSKRGRPLLRAAAYMFAVRSITTGGLFRAEYERVLARNGGVALKALAAVMRSSLRLMYSVARDRRTFTLEPPRRRLRTGAQEATA
jgi:transposase